MTDRQLIADLLSALEYHTEQTRPIEFSKVAIEAAREYLRKPEQPAQQEPVATFDEVWEAIDWDKWRMEPIRELVRMIHDKTRPQARDCKECPCNKQN